MEYLSEITIFTATILAVVSWLFVRHLMLVKIPALTKQIENCEETLAKHVARETKKRVRSPKSSDEKSVVTPTEPAAA